MSYPVPEMYDNNCKRKQIMNFPESMQVLKSRRNMSDLGNDEGSTSIPVVVETVGEAIT